MATLKKQPLLPLNPNATATAAATAAATATATAISIKCKPAMAEKENLALQLGQAGLRKEEKKKLRPDGTKLQQLHRTGVAAPPLKPSSLQLRMERDSPGSALLAAPMAWDPLPPSSSSCEAWEFSDSEPAPASSWATLPNRALLCRPLPLDVGRCTCVIAKEAATGARGVALYSLYTNEGQGRQDRKLAVARHRKRRGRSEFIVAQNQDGLFCSSDGSFLGTEGANVVGSKYQIWGQGSRADDSKCQSKRLLGVVAFAPTIATLTGSFRSIRAWIPKNQSMQLKNGNSAQIQHISGLPKDWQQKKNRADQLCSRAPFYNNVTKRYELDFRERAGRMGYKVQPSVKNFQMTLQENGRQTILQLGRIGKSKYIMDFRYPLTGYQAFCICLASIDSKLCCTL